MREYQHQNRIFERDVNAVALLGLTKPELIIPSNDRFDNKENSINKWSRLNQEEKKEETTRGILHHFMKQ